MGFLTQIASAVEDYRRFVDNQVRSAREDAVEREKVTRRWKSIHESMETTLTPTGLKLPRPACQCGVTHQLGFTNRDAAGLRQRADLGREISVCGCDRRTAIGDRHFDGGRLLVSLQERLWPSHAVEVDLRLAVDVSVDVDTGGGGR